MLAASILKTIEDFGITDKVLAITSDNASNMDTMFTELKTLLQARGVMNHVHKQQDRFQFTIVSSKPSVEFENQIF
ncbi:unnamed protein product [Allacma fusca]|uniref:Uncharacterized protein n=1 Tax=Allacma fusca TaxID=39272 RepID=A0A8J2KZ23_9HEXA|nr:unnamed protein product [Allacma fusca]